MWYLAKMKAPKTIKAPVENWYEDELEKAWKAIEI
jgi:hypothetical protein